MCATDSIADSRCPAASDSL
ncbi:hypothetical protein [Microcoleus sp. Aus8_D3]